MGLDTIGPSKGDRGPEEQRQFLQFQAALVKDWAADASDVDDLAFYWVRLFAKHARDLFDAGVPLDALGSGFRSLHTQLSREKDVLCSLTTRMVWESDAAVLELDRRGRRVGCERFSLPAR